MSSGSSDSGTTDIGGQVRDQLIRDLKEEKFLLYFQSIVPVAPAAPDPALFLPILEQHGLMPLMDRWVTGQAARWVRNVHAASKGRASRCSINLSRDTVRRD